jgi:hypothetical protein
MLKNIYRKGRLINQYIQSRSKISKYTSEFQDIETYCVFIGYPRSGHSLIGSLLDAHPDMVFSNELNALRHIKYKFNREQLYYLILKNSQNFSLNGRSHTGYSYKVDNQWQGRYRKIKVIGDKRGSGSIKKLFYRPDLLDLLQKKIRQNIKFIHVMRNPFDNISTMFVKSSQLKLEGSIDYYFFLADEITKLKKNIPPDDIYELRHETFILKPKESLTGLTNFLGVEAEESYLESCTKILFKNPKKTRHNAPWTDELIARVNRQISDYPFLSGYTFDD